MTAYAMVSPSNRSKGKIRTFPENTTGPLYGALHEYIYDNTGDRGQFKCKIYGQTLVNGKKVTAPLKLYAPTAACQ